MSDFDEQCLEVEIDVPKEPWLVTIRHKGTVLKTISIDASPEALVSYLKIHYPDSTFQLAHAAKLSTSWMRRKFIQQDIDCVFINASDIT